MSYESDNPFQSSFPRIFPTKIFDSPKSFHGFINISHKDYFIGLNTPFYPYSRNLTLKTDIQLLEILQKSNFTENEEKLKENCTVLDYLKTLQEISEKYIEENSPAFCQHLDNDQHEHFSLLLAHIEELGWSKVSNVAEDFSAIDMECKDAKERLHILHVKIPSKYPAQFAAIQGDLPTEVSFKKKTLLSIYNAWEQQLFYLQAFWNALDDLDDTAFIIDPAKPMRKHTTRRIMLDNQVSLHLSVSPDEPDGPPKCHLLGPSSLVTPLNDKLIDLYQAWDDTESIVYNLEHILKVRVVRKTSLKNGVEDESVLDDFNVECAVCYCLHLEEQLPDFTCDHCKKSFHLLCLYDWLRSLPSSRQTAQFIRGDCPYCTKAITCKVPS